MPAFRIHSEGIKLDLIFLAALAIVASVCEWLG